MLCLCLVHTRPFVDEIRMAPHFDETFANNFTHSRRGREKKYMLFNLAMILLIIYFDVIDTYESFELLMGF